MEAHSRDTSLIQSVMESIKSCFNSYSRIKHIWEYLACYLVCYLMIFGSSVVLRSEMFWCRVFLLFSLQVISHRKVMRRRGLNWSVLIFLSLQVKIFILSLACPSCLDSSVSCFLTGYIACRHFGHFGHLRQEIWQILLSSCWCLEVGGGGKIYKCEAKQCGDDQQKWSAVFPAQLNIMWVFSI